ncbi:MAG: anti-sigma factor [Noviherbaspirillum sp.]
MNLQAMRKNGPLREKLAAEYVLGTLKGGARRRFEKWVNEDAVIQKTVAAWQDRLYPLAELTPASQPSRQVWEAIDRQLDLDVIRSRQENRSFFWSGLRNDLRFWRGLGMASTALATILIAVLLTRLPEPATPVTSYVAMLADEKSQPVMLITGDAGQRRMTVKVLAQQTVAADKSLELWAVPKDGAPRSLGLVAPHANVTLPLPDNATPDSTPLLAISLEPKGGSPNPNGPSGPILFKGAWLRL